MAGMLLTGERDEDATATTGGLTMPAAGEDREDAPAAWTLREMDGASAVLFATMDVLNLSSRGKVSFAAANT